MDQENKSANATITTLRVSVLAHLERDAQLIVDVLRKAGVQAEVCSPNDLAALPRIVEQDCLILSEELLSPRLIQSLHTILENQPPWSDFPVLLLTLGGEVSLSTERRQALRVPLGNVVLLERPIRPETLLSAVQNALRGRRRQYQIRDHIEQYKKAEAALRQAEKLAVAGRLASSIAHEINNPLEAVTNLLYLMRLSDDAGQIKEYLETAENELARVSEITTHTLQFYRQNSRPAAMLLTEILDSALNLYQPRLVAAGIKVDKRFDSVMPIQGMAGELRQVFSNFIGNSLDAMRNGGMLLLRVHNSRDYRGSMAPGVRITIADTGIGIPVELRRKIFDPFVTTKGATGTGLGLWISSEILQKHNGTLHLRSRSGGAVTGTVFTIFFPRTNSYTKAAAPKEAAHLERALIMS